jgi:hypothetical protein
VATSKAALHKMLEKVTLFEYSLMGCFASSTPLPLIHKLLDEAEDEEFDVVKFFEAYDDDEHAFQGLGNGTESLEAMPVMEELDVGEQ